MNRVIRISTRSSDVFKRVFVESVKECGISESDPPPLWKNETVLTLFSRLQKKCNILASKVSEDIVIVPSNGYLLQRESLPYSFIREIVPFLWDCWPGSWDTLAETLKLLKVRLCFVTSTQVREIMQSRLPEIKFVHVYEAVNPQYFNKGKNLTERNNPIFEIGRKHTEYHRIVASYFNTDSRWIDGFADDYFGTLSNTQIAVSFPRCDTHKEMAGEIETLTERYWESMLSRCLMVGRAPKELVDIMGYNPVVEVDWTNPEKQLAEIYVHLSDYQELVDRNYHIAKERGVWCARIPMILEEIRSFFGEN